MSYDDFDHNEPDDGLPGTAMCIALVISMPLWLPVALVLGFLCSMIARRPR